MMHDDSRESVAGWDGQPMGEHWTHHDAGVREIVAREVAAERERIAEAIEADTRRVYSSRTPYGMAYADGYESATVDAARIARGGGE